MGQKGLLGPASMKSLAKVHMDLDYVIGTGKEVWIWLLLLNFLLPGLDPCLPSFPPQWPFLPLCSLSPCPIAPAPWTCLSLWLGGPVQGHCCAWGCWGLRPCILAAQGFTLCQRRFCNCPKPECTFHQRNRGIGLNMYELFCCDVVAGIIPNHHPSNHGSFQMTSAHWCDVWI